MHSIFNIFKKHTFMAFLVLLLFSVSSASARDFTFDNRCGHKVWPGILSNPGKLLLQNGGFELQPGQAVTIDVPAGWAGRFWGRAGCTFDNTGHGTCETGDCGGLLGCAGVGGAPPASLAEFTLDSPLDFYDVSLVDGYNVPISIVPSNSTCKTVRCVSDLNQSCPANLQDLIGSRVVGCKSACLTFNQPQYCCTGEYGTPDKCKPTQYSLVFKAACPDAYSYAYDDATSTFTCQGTNYSIVFC